MNNFDKIFSEKLQTEQDFDFREADWDEVSDRLDMHAPIVAPTWRKALVPIVMAGLVGVIGFLWLKLDKTSDALQDLKKDLQNNTVLQRDTVLQTVILRDTIFAAADATSRINTHDISWVGKPGTGVVNPFLSLGDDLAKNINQTFSEFDYLEKDKSETPYKLGVLNQKSSAIERIEGAPNSVHSIEHSYVVYEKGEEILFAKNNPITSNPHFQLLGAKFGLNIGKSFIPDNQLTAVKSTNIGLKAEFLFVKNLSLVAGLDFYNLSYQTLPDFFGGEIPQPEDPIYQQEDLFFIQADQNFTQLKLGFKYTFNTKEESNIRPYVGLNYLATANFKKAFFYQYNPDRYSVPFFETVSRNSDIIANGFGVDLGVEYQPKNWLSIQFETYYHTSNRSLESLYHDLVGVRTAALIRF